MEEKNYAPYPLSNGKEEIQLNEKNMKKTLIFLTLIIFVLALVFTTPLLAFAESGELVAAKDAAIFQLESFLENEAYTEAEKKVQKEMEKIVDDAILKIQEAESVEEVNRVKVAALNDLGNIDIGGNDWKKMLAVGILLVVLLIVAVVSLVIKKKREIGKRAPQDEDDDELLSTVEEVTLIKRNEDAPEKTKEEETQTTETEANETSSNANQDEINEGDSER